MEIIMPTSTTTYVLFMEHIPLYKYKEICHIKKSYYDHAADNPVPERESVKHTFFDVAAEYGNCTANVR